MKIFASILPESVLCTLPDGEQVEVTMLSVEGDEVFAEPDIKQAVEIVVLFYATRLY